MDESSVKSKVSLLPPLALDLDQASSAGFLPDMDGPTSGQDVNDETTWTVPSHLIQNACRAVIRCLWQTSANLVVAPVQDLLGLDGRARMNTPGCATGCWTFRMNTAQMESLDIDRLLRLNRMFQRARCQRQ
jgi:4-alpha-glucanotransferase